MITTKIENELRKRLYGIFWDRADPLCSNVWQAKLVQCIEKNLLQSGVNHFMPDSYGVHFPSLIDITKDDSQRFVEDMTDFILQYKKDSGYAMLNSLTIRVESTHKSLNNSIEIDARMPSKDGDGLLISVGIREKNRDKGIRFVHFSAPEKLSAGRSKGADIMLDHQFVSDIHAMCRFEHVNKVYINDLQSLNGTYVKGFRLEPLQEYEFKLPLTVDLARICTIYIRSNSGFSLPEKSETERIPCMV